ncbi:MAG TPA: ComEC/Rec2 family competence protein, partial [Longimicrobiales bacterium]|nr:ComEC/Rec2 family competence protein [Longimicrobiales bacterium]
MLAAVYAMGVAASLSGADVLFLALLLLAPLVLPIPPWCRPRDGPPSDLSVRLLLVALLAAGLAQASSLARETARDCRLALADGVAVDVRGVVRTEARWGRTEVAVRDGLPGGCRVDARVRLPPDVEAPGPGAAVRVRGRWRADPRPGVDPDRAGEVEGRSVEPSPELAPSRVVAWQVGALRRIREVFPRRAALVSALVLAHKRDLDPGVREAFARSGTAHLLAISGFHVGVVAALLLAG